MSRSRRRLLTLYVLAHMNDLGLHLFELFLDGLALALQLISHIALIIAHKVIRALISFL